MSTQAEQIKAQKMAFNEKPTKPWHKHLICPAELKMIIEQAQKYRLMRVFGMEVQTEPIKPIKK